VALLILDSLCAAQAVNLDVTHGNARVTATPNQMTTEVFAKLSWAVNL